ncbi:carotenoid oxygenase [Leptolyngbya sp. Heron Island J]|uniref:HAD hydrolase-like protein n=1 Tax=Leptolyngbya sp. Heron Island J TaxID=1385935 RepID=UPI0003B9D87A|nr:HAD hydrolase-like protein [Leptolyngbya sp. Heron Island J]ESA35232.1 carotenoid oxygenase [Leptolyngbya sp. Heron Island J]
MTVLIFDFDGTIADTLETIVAITNRLASQYDYPQTTPERLKYLRALSTAELLAQSHVPLFQVPFLMRRVRRELHQDVDSIQTFHHLSDVLMALAADGHTIMVASSNAPSTIRPFLERHDLGQVFSQIYGNIGLLGKARSLRRIMRRHRLLPEEILYIGDETRDIEAAHCQGVAVAAVSWGFSDRTALEAQGPTFLVDTPEELYQAVGEFHRSQRWSFFMSSKPGDRAETPSYVHHAAD